MPGYRDHYQNFRRAAKRLARGTAGDQLTDNFITEFKAQRPLSR